MFYSTPKFCGIPLGHLGVNMVALGGETCSCHVCLNFFQFNHMHSPWNLFSRYTKNVILESVTIKSFECSLFY